MSFMKIFQTKKKWESNSYSHLFYQAREGLKMRKISAYWFSGILSAADAIEPENVHQDLEKEEMYDMLKILNVAFTDIVGFFPKESSESVLKLLDIMKDILKISSNDIAPAASMSYTMWMYQITFLNTLGFYCIKQKQYNSGILCYDKIIKVYNTILIETVHEIFLTAISNYILCLKTIENKKVSTTLTQLTQKLVEVYGSLIQKYLTGGSNEGNILLLLTVYRQHESILRPYYKEKNGILIRRHLQVKQSKENPTTDMILYHQMLKKNRNNKFNELIIKKRQINFFLTINQEEGLVKGCQLRRKKEQKRMKPQIPEKRLVNLEKLSDDYLTLQNIQKVDSNTLEQKNFHRLSFDTKNSSILSFKHQSYISKDSTVFQTNFIFMNMSNEGIVISDFVKQYKQFLSWNVVKNLMKKFRYTEIFGEMLPVHNYYDIARVLSYYLKEETLNRRKMITLAEIPHELCDLNMHVKLFRKEGPFITVYVMNQYNVSVVEEVIDCYLSDYEYYFKKLNIDEYIEMLNNKIQGKPVSESQQFSLERIKKIKEVIRKELQNQINLNEFQELVTPEMKNSPCKILLLYKNSKRFYLNFTCSSEDFIDFSVTELQLKQEKKTRSLKIPKYTLKRFFPYNKQNETSCLCFFGKFIIEGYRHCFENYPFSFINKNYFGIKIYATKTEMILKGKYKTPLFAMLVGSSERVWGIVIKIYEIAQINELNTFIINPYYDLMKFVIKMDPKECKDVLIRNLKGGTVKDTYNFLLKKKIIGKSINITQYWNYEY